MRDNCADSLFFSNLLCLFADLSSSVLEGEGSEGEGEGGWGGDGEGEEDVADEGVDGGGTLHGVVGDVDLTFVVEIGVFFALGNLLLEAWMGGIDVRVLVTRTGVCERSVFWGWIEGICKAAVLFDIDSTVLFALPSFLTTTVDMGDTCGLNDWEI